MLDAIPLYICAFCLGSIPSAYIVARVLKDIDLRTVGSGNLGASNIGAQIGKKWVAPVVLFDLVGKGMSPVLLSQTGVLPYIDGYSVAIAALISLIGHNWCCFLKFDGGRGILVVLGSLAVFEPLFCLVMLISGLCVWFVTKNVPLSVLIGLILMPLGAMLWNCESGVVFFTVIAVLLVLAKRILGNRGRKVDCRSTRKVLVNRILFDRDISDRLEWIN